MDGTSVTCVAKMIAAPEVNEVGRENARAPAKRESQKQGTVGAGVQSVLLVRWWMGTLTQRGRRERTASL